MAMSPISDQWSVSVPVTGFPEYLGDDSGDVGAF